MNYLGVTTVMNKHNKDLYRWFYPGPKQTLEQFVYGWDDERLIFT